MKIEFHPNQQTINAFSILLQRDPKQTPDELMNRLIQDAANAVSPQIEKDELQGVSTRVTEFIVANHKPLQAGNVSDYLDICYKRGIINKDYIKDRTHLHRVCKWIMDDLILHPKFRVVTIATAHAFIRDR